MPPKQTNREGKQRMTEDQSQHQPDLIAHSARQARGNQSRREQASQSSAPQPPRPSPAAPASALLPSPPPTSSSGKPLVSFKGNLKLEGQWNLQCYEYKYVTEHLQLHRFPIDNCEQPRKIEQVEPSGSNQVRIKDGQIEAKSREGSAPENGVQLEGEEVSGGGRAEGGGDREDDSALRELEDERFHEMIPSTEHQEVQGPSSTLEPAAHAPADVEQPDTAHVASVRSPYERTKLEPGDETEGETLPADAATQRNSHPDQATGRARGLSGSVPAQEEEQSGERRRSRMSIFNFLNDDAGDEGQRDEKSETKSPLKRKLSTIRRETYREFPESDDSSGGLEVVPPDYGKGKGGRSSAGEDELWPERTSSQIAEANTSHESDEETPSKKPKSNRKRKPAK